MTQKTVQVSESLRLGLVLALVGGYLDAYTYLCRGGVFANAETGNMVLLGIHLAQGHWQGALKYLSPVLAFGLGILLAEWMHSRLKNRRQRLHWRQAVVLIEMTVLLLSVLAPLGGRWDMAVNWTVGFVCALQVQTFRSLRGRPYATTMCTGNLRSGTELLFRYFETGDRQLLVQSLRYYIVIATFIFGAAVSAVVSLPLGRFSPLVPCAGLLAAALMMRRRMPE